MPKIHHLNCGTMCPLGRRLIHGEGGWLQPAEMCCHCLLIESADGLVLVDTGLGTADVAHPARLGGLFVGVTRPRLRIEETALHQVQALGFAAGDVRHVVLTHLDLDHAGGLADFPAAAVHVLAAEQQAALARPSAGERARYRPAQFAHGPRWALHQAEGERWFGFDAVQALPGSTDQILLVPLAGHTRGHCGVAVNTGAGWLLHCGDAYFFRGEVDPQRPYCTPGLRLFQGLVQVDGRQRHANQARLLELARAHGGEVALFCAHDPAELARLRQGAQAAGAVG
ncbi:MAG: MBL fold metallo-hydrolase [Nevskia sp.]|nr:MBL fold metallo-hydrolase [Nevskia sp.]